MNEELGCCEAALVQFEECEKKFQKLLSEGSAAVSDIELASHLVQQLECHVSNLGKDLPPSPSLAQLAITKKVLRLCQCQQLTESVLFEALVRELGNLFKTTFTALKGFLEGAATEQMSHHQLNSLLTEIMEVASLSLHFDPSLLSLCWRSVGKLSCGSVASVNLDSLMPGVIGQLCVDLEALTQQQGVVDLDPLLEKKLRSGRFLSSILMRLLFQFPVAILECSKVIAHLLLTTHQHVHAVRNVALHSRLESNLLLLHEPLVECVSTSKKFLEHFLDISSVSSDQHYGWGLCLVSLLKHFPSFPDELQRYCLEMSSSRDEVFASCRLLDAIFACLEKCHEELSASFVVAGVMCNGHPQGSVSFYEWMCCHMCLALSCLSCNDLLHSVEKSLVSYLLKAQTFSAQLASDCLTFIARLGGEIVAFTYCQVLMELLESLSPSIPSHSSPVVLVGSLLNRMLGLLPPHAQLDILSLHVAQQSWVWSHIQLHSLHSDTLTVINHQLLSNTVNKLMATSNEGSFEEVGPSLLCLCALFQHSINSCGVHTSNVIAILLRLLHSPSVYCHEICISLISHLLPQLSSEQTSEVLAHVSKLTSCQQSFSLTLATRHILSHSAALHFHSIIEESCIGILSQLYSTLFYTRHWLVTHCTLESFRAFAEATPYAGAVEFCIPPALTDTVIAFLHKVPYKADIYQARYASCSHPNHSLVTLQVPNDSTSVLRDLHLSWKKVQSLEEKPSAKILSQLITLNSSISSFVAKHSS